MAEQAPLPEVPPIPVGDPRRNLTDMELDDIRKKLIESGGKIEVLGADALNIMRDVIYTCRMKANPLQDDGTPEADKPKRTRAKAGTESVNRKQVTGIDVNSLLG